jgi:hypothetical protein
MFFLVRTAPWTLAATWTDQLEPAKQTTNDLPGRRHDAVDRGAPLIELIWSYWHEEGRLVQTMNAIRMRLQNRRGRIFAIRSPTSRSIRFARSTISSGLHRDEQHRLTLPRRAYEYDHHNGVTPGRLGAPCGCGCRGFPKSRGSRYLPGHDAEARCKNSAKAASFLRDDARE